MIPWMLKLREAFSESLPGPDAQMLMSPSVRRPAASDGPRKKSAVLIVLYENDHKMHTVFIKRAEYDGVHSGQISFPGGMHEPDDLSIMHTALRETREEIGIKPGAVTVIGALTPLHIPVSNIEVHPYVAVCKQRPDFKHDPSEVQYLIETSLEALLDPVNRKSEKMTFAGEVVDVPFFLVKGHHIWGATAMILSEFLEIIKRVTSDA
jgi:8-oxo-dGTP pyrophosphatase MutT (NUDIX family)